MATIEKLGWIGLILTLLIAVAAVIIQPIYDKAVETQQEIEEIQFEDPSASLPVYYAFENRGVLDGDNRKAQMVTNMAHNV